VLTFGLAAFALAGIARQFWIGSRAHGPWRAVRGNPRLYGGLIVHTGIVIIAVAIASSSAYTTRTEVRLERGDSVKVADYTVTYLGSRVERSDQKNTFVARVRIERGGDDLGVYAPAISTFPGAPQGIGTPSVRTGLREDVYLTLISSPNRQGRVTIGVAVNPMMLWLWLGGGVLALGTIVALTPKSRRRPDAAPAPDAEPVRDADEPVGAPA
jgi:cytochrome c-type biogenesis protein CcmF